MKISLKNTNEALTAIGLWIVISTVYVKTSAPTVGFIDSGELAAAACTLGIAHPTGYPLFTLLGRVFSLCPVAGTEIARLNIMSALFTAAASVVFFYVVLELFGKQDNKFYAIAAAAYASLALAFSQTFWTQGAAVEVYSLHLLLILLTILFFLKALREEKVSWWYLFAYTLGLSFANHLTTILLAPALLFLFLAEYKFSKPAFERVRKIIPPFILGLSVYFYLPIRASSNPILNWGNPQSLEMFLRHVTGKQFRVWMFSSTEAAEKQFKYFLQHTPTEFYYIPLLFVVIGFAVLLSGDKKKFLFVLLLLTACVGYSVNYDIHDIDSYFLLAFISLMIFSSFGMLKFIQFFKGKISFIVLSGMIILQVSKNWRAVDQSGNYIVEEYTKNILQNIPRNSIVMSYQWDYFVSASYYFQYVEKFRTDVTVLDKELFRRSWYFHQLHSMHPALIERSQNEISLFLRELDKFENDLPYDFNSIEGRYTDVLQSIFAKSGKDSFCFVTSEIEAKYTSGYIRVPFGLVQMVTKDTSYIALPPAQFVFRKDRQTGLYSEQIRKLSSSLLFQRAAYERLWGKEKFAQKYESDARQILIPQF